MTYPRKLMSITELNEECNIPKKWLYMAIHSENSRKFTYRPSKTGKVMIDTKMFDKYYYNVYLTHSTRTVYR